MVYYNSNRTAYYPSYSDDWFVVPAGKTRAPLFRGRYSVRLQESDHIGTNEMDHFDQADREVMLEAHRLGVLNETWKKFAPELRKREEQAAIYREQLATKLVTRATVDRRIF